MGPTAPNSDRDVPEDADEKQRHHQARLVEVGRLAAIANHELRQPLLGIKAFSEMIAQLGAVPPEAREWARKIHVQAARMERMVEGMRNLSRPARTLRERVNLDDSMSEVLDFARFLFRESRVQLTQTLDSRALVDVSTDELQQMVLNLLANARDAVVGAGGGCVQVITVSDGAQADIFIADDGPGLARHRLEEIDAGFSTTKTDGTGLGLNVSRALARRQGGSLDLVDEHPAIIKPPVRTIFRLRLPRAA